MWDFVAYAKENKEKVKGTLNDIKRDVKRDASEPVTTGRFVGGVLVNTFRMLYIGGVAVLTATAYVLSFKFVDDMVIQPIKEWTKEAEEDDDWYTTSFSSPRPKNTASAEELLEIAVPEDTPAAGSGGAEGSDEGGITIEMGSYLYYAGDNLYGTYGGNGYGGNANGHPYTVKYDYELEILIDTEDWTGRVVIERLYVEDSAGSQITESNLEYLREHTSAAATCTVHMDIDTDGVYYYLTDFVWDNDEPFVWGFDESGLCIVGTNGKKYYDGVGNESLPYYKDTVILLQPYYANKDYYYAFTGFIPTDKPNAEVWSSAAALLIPQEISVEILSEMGDESVQENAEEEAEEKSEQDPGTGQDEEKQPEDGEEDEDTASERDAGPEEEEAEFVEPGPPTVIAEGGGTVEVEPDGTVTLQPDEGNHVDRVRINGQDTPVPQGGGKITGLTPEDQLDAKFQNGAPQGGNNPAENTGGGSNGGDHDRDGGADGGDNDRDGGADGGDNDRDGGVDSGDNDRDNGADGEDLTEPEDRQPRDPGQAMAGLSRTRAQIIHYLWNLAGQPLAGIDNPFTDVYESDYYYEAVRWAAEIGIIPRSGSGFQPHRVCTYRELYRMTKRYFALTSYGN